MTNREKLELAFERLLAGKPIRISPSRKISPTAVEDEAGVSRSLLRNNPDYHDLFDKIVKKKDKSAGKSELSSVDTEKKTLKDRLKKANADIALQKAKVDCLESKYSRLLACNAELASVVNEKRFEEHMRQISANSLEEALKINREQTWK